MAVHEHRERFKGTIKRAAGGFELYPMVLVNGQLEVTGTVDYYQVLSLVRRYLLPEKG